MQATLVFGAIVIILFVLSYLTRRRFGVLGLALCAGLLLSSSWANVLTPMLAKHTIALPLPLATLVVCGLILAPSILLLFSGPTYNKKLGRLGGALIFTIFAVVLLAEPLSTSLRFDSLSLQIYKMLIDSRSMIIVIGIVLALLDILMTHTPRRHHSRE